MAEEIEQDKKSIEHLPQIEESTKFNFITSIWIVPFIALMIAGWLTFQYFSELGPQIKIIFPSNEGLKAGQSQIKYRDVPVGVVEKITLQKDGDGVVVIARMNKDTKPFLNKDTKFWIVKPELGVYGISGLDTIVSGNYIGIYAKREERSFQNTFIGLDHVYRGNVTGGKYFVLKTYSGDSSVRTGTPVYFKNIRVGQVEYVVLGTDDIFVNVIVFIEKQYTEYINTSTKFWIRRTLNVFLHEGSLDVDVAPFKDMLLGAIEFSTTRHGKKSALPEDFTFILHKSKSTVNSKKLGKAEKEIKLFMVETQDPISKLKIGSPVQYRGFKIGSVIRISLFYDKTSHMMNGKVVIEMDTSVFTDPNDTNSTGEANFYQAVAEGMRAQILPSDPILGMLYVDLNFKHDDGNKSITMGKQYPVVPSVSGETENIVGSLGEILAKINALKLDELVNSVTEVVHSAKEPIAKTDILVEDLQKTVAYLNKMMSKKSFERMPDETSKALRELTKTLKETKRVVKGYDQNSLLNRQLSETLKILSKTSKEMDVFLKMLNRKPDALIFGDN